ncbi:MAG: hypothetical protein ACYC0Y_06245 [Pirellulales bacterium]
MTTMPKREKLLAAIVGGVIAFLILSWGFSRVSGVFSQGWAKRTALKAEVEKNQASLIRGNRAAKRLADWELRSLPTNRDLARSLYQNWLLSLVDKVKLQSANVDSQPSVPRKGATFEKLAFTVRGSGTLEQLTQFLYDFYQAGHLHQLRRLEIEPGEGGKQLALTFTIEALVLPGADRKDKLTAQKATRSLPPLAQYNEAIVKRNLFGPYVPPREPERVVDEPPPPKPKEFDPVKAAFVTAIVQVDEKPQVWVNLRTTGEILKLRSGEKIDVGTYHGTISSIGAMDVVLQAQGKQWRATLGKSIFDAVEIPGAAPPEKSKVAPTAGETSEKPAPEKVEASQSLQIAPPSDKMGGGVPGMVGAPGGHTSKRE